MKKRPIIRKQRRGTELQDKKREKESEKQAPPVLYRYLSWMKPLQKRLLTEGEIYFSPPRSSNDPFDCQICIDLNATAGEIRRYLSDVDKMPEHWYNLPPGLRNAGLRQQVMHLKTEKGRQEVKLALLDGINTGYGILSFATCRSSLLMWAYYGDRHCGLCVGIDTSLLDQFVSHLAGDIGSELRPVDYKAKYPLINPFKQGFHPGDYAYKIPKIKSSDWKDEEEWRMIVFLHPNLSRAYVLPGGIIKEVIIGCRMPAQHQEEVKQTIRENHPNVKLFRARPSETDFVLEFDDITHELHTPPEEK